MRSIGRPAMAGREDLTRLLAQTALDYRVTALPADTLTVATQCIIDWFAVVLPGALEQCAILVADELESTGHGSCTVIGRHHRLSAQDAALANGVAAHALDFDDVSRAMQGHPTVATFPAALAIAEAEGKSGRDLMNAYIAGYEIACILGARLAPSHYAKGFHATGTIGTVGAAVAAGLLLDLDEAQMVNAIGLAATQAAGLKAMFGSMAKPLHAGKAAANGVLAARLARRGFTANPAALEADQGFISTLSAEPSRPVVISRPGVQIVKTLFKYHAACYMTHSTIDCLNQLRERAKLSPQAVAAVEIHVAPGHLSACNIADPSNALQSKFSLRHAAALALHGRDSSALATFSDEGAADPELAAIRQRVSVYGDMPAGGAVNVVVECSDGTRHVADHDSGVVEHDLARQGARIEAKFMSLAVPVVGAEAAERLLAIIRRLDQAGPVTDLLTGGATIAQARMVRPALG
ncbi:MmgE/PrpD family protein [Sphingobium sp. AN641]|uniref:MmgE/PrpD family protein n=1 Tax=Sphingobium sp. AN641 TaxID=3133443 RepID=UPI0030C13DE0